MLDTYTYTHSWGRKKKKCRSKVETRLLLVEAAGVVDATQSVSSGVPILVDAQLRRLGEHLVKVPVRGGTYPSPGVEVDGDELRQVTLLVAHTLELDHPSVFFFLCVAVALGDCHHGVRVDGFQYPSKMAGCVVRLNTKSLSHIFALSELGELLSHGQARVKLSL